MMARKRSTRPGKTIAIMACCRFRGHRDKVFDGTTGELECRAPYSAGGRLALAPIESESPHPFFQHSLLGSRPSRQSGIRIPPVRGAYAAVLDGPKYP